MILFAGINLLCTFTSTNNNNMKNTATQSNLYNVIYSNGNASKIYITASNIKEAQIEAKKIQSQIGSFYYKLKRCYDGGVRG